MNTFSKMSDFSLRTRFIIVFATVLLWLAIANFVLIFLFVGYVREYNDMMKTVTLTNAINGELKIQLDDEVREIVYGKISFESGSQYSLLDTMNSNLNQIETADEQEQFNKEIAAVRQSLSTTKEYINKLGEEIKYNYPAEKRNITYEYITIITDIVNDQVQELLHATLIESEQSKDTIIEHIKRDIIIYALVFTAVILASLWFAWYISGTIIKPINRLRKNANYIAEGNLTVDAIVISSKNEIGDLCRSYNRMSNNLKDIILNVRSTNDLVMLSSKDIHQSIQENRLAGEEVANATQTISINLQEHDELIKQAVKTYDDLLLSYKQLVSKASQTKIHSDMLTQTINQGKLEAGSYVRHHRSFKDSLIDILSESETNSEQSSTSAQQIEKSLHLIDIITRETQLLSITIKDPTPQNSTNKEIQRITERVEHLVNDVRNLIQHAAENAADVHQHTLSINKRWHTIKKDITHGNHTEQLEVIFESTDRFSSDIHKEMNKLMPDMHVVMEHMDRVRKDIRAIEHRSKISKSEVISIAMMGEEQLATLEEVSESSSQLVEHIKKMKNDIRQFKV